MARSYIAGCFLKGDLRGPALEFPGLTIKNPDLWYVCMYVDLWSLFF